MVYTACQAIVQQHAQQSKEDVAQTASWNPSWPIDTAFDTAHHTLVNYVLSLTRIQLAGCLCCSKQKKSLPLARCGCPRQT
eukprot:3242481-Amphidinium_carterae.1